MDPTVELDGRALKEIVRECVKSGRIRIPTYGRQRADQRQITTPEIVTALRCGSLATECIVSDRYRYRAEGTGDVVVIFTFEVDEHGALIIVVTTWRL